MLRLVRGAQRLSPGGLRMASTGPMTATPPPDTARGATADLCDVHVLESVDVIAEQKVAICQPIFR